MRALQYFWPRGVEVVGVVNLVYRIYRVVEAGEGEVRAAPVHRHVVRCSGVRACYFPGAAA